MDLDGFKSGCVGISVPGVIGDEVASHSYSCPLFFFFFRSYGADGVSVGDSATFGDLVFVNEENSTGAFDSVSNALG